MICFISFSLTDFLIPFLGYDTPSTAMLGFAILSIFVVYAMWKYELFSLDLTIASEKIFSNISDYLILTDHNGKILSTNQSLYIYLRPD